MTKAKSRKLPRPFKMPWGEGEIIEEASYIGRWHEPAIQLMRYADGSEIVRFAHYSHGIFSRSPLMVSAKEFAKLKKSIDKNPRLKKLLRKLVE